MVGSSWRSSNDLMSSLRFAFSFFFFFFPSTYFLFFFYMERNKEQHLAKTCAVFFKRRLEQTWFCGTLGNRSERLSSGKLWANINEAFKLEKEKKTHTHCSKRKKFEQLEGRRRSSEIVTFFTSKPPPPTLRGHRLIGAERQWQLGLMEPMTRRKEKKHCGWEGDVSVRFNFKGFNKSGRIGGRQRQCGLSVFTLTSVSSRRVKKKKKASCCCCCYGVTGREWRAEEERKHNPADYLKWVRTSTM